MNNNNIKRHVICEKGRDYNINEKSIVKEIKYKNGNMTIKHSKNYNRKHSIGKVIKLSKNKRLDKNTGKVIECKDTGEYKTRENIRASMRGVEEYIRNNFFGNDNEIITTLTYTETQRNYDIAQRDAEYFCDKLRDTYKDIDYIYVIELQEDRESWHIHMLIKQNNITKTRITNKDIQTLWNKGGTKTEKIRTIEGLSIYISKIETKLIQDINDRSKDDLRIKKGRKLYKCSKGIKKPIETKKTYEEAKKDVEDKQYIGSETNNIVMIEEDTSKDIEDENRYKERVFNVIKKQYYKSKEQQ